MVRVVAVLAGAGWVAALIWHVTAIRGRPLFGNGGGVVLVGVFAVCLPAALQVTELYAVRRVYATWRLALAGAPTWMKGFVGASFAYTFVNFFLATGAPVGSVSGEDPEFARVGSGHAVAFYAFAAVMRQPARQS